MQLSKIFPHVYGMHIYICLRTCMLLLSLAGESGDIFKELGMERWWSRDERGGNRANCRGTCRGETLLGSVGTGPGPTGTLM